MKVVKTNNNKHAMTLAELEALAQFEASDRKGQAVFHPWVGPGSPAPHCVVLPKDLTRIAVTYLDGEHWVEDGRWYRRDDDGAVTPIDDVLERCWQAAMAVRSRLKKQLGINAYVVAVAVFPTMEPDESILAAAASRGTRVLFGMDDHVERLAALPGEQDLQHPLQARYIPDEADALSRPPATATAAAEPETASLDVGDGRVVIHAGTVHLHLTCTSPSWPLPTAATTTGMSCRPSGSGRQREDTPGHGSPLCPGVPLIGGMAAGFQLRRSPAAAPHFRGVGFTP